MDELAKRRFEHLAGRIAAELVAYKDAEKQLLGNAIALHTLLNAYLDTYQRAHRETPEVAQLRQELSTTWHIITDPQTFPALEAAHMHFDDIATGLGELVGALP